MNANRASNGFIGNWDTAISELQQPCILVTAIETTHNAHVVGNALAGPQHMETHTNTNHTTLNMLTYRHHKHTLARPHLRTVTPTHAQIRSSPGANSETRCLANYVSHHCARRVTFLFYRLLCATCYIYIYGPHAAHCLLSLTTASRTRYSVDSTRILNWFKNNCEPFANNKSVLGNKCDRPLP